MLDNLTHFLENQFTQEVTAKTAAYLGESASNTQTAIRTAIPLTIAGFISKGSTLDGIKELYDSLRIDAQNHLDIRHLHTSEEDFMAFTNYADGTVNMVLGAEQDKLADLVTLESGVSSASAIRLFNLIASMASGMIRTKVAEEGIGLSGLANWLMAQGESTKNALPSEVVNMLGLEELGDYLGDTSSAVLSTEKFGFKMLMPWIIGLVALLAALYYIRSCSKEFVPEPKSVMEDSITVQQPPTATSDSLNNQKPEIIVKSLPNGIALNIPSSGTEARLVAFIEDPTRLVDKDTWFEFDRLYFKSASAEMEPTSEEQLQNIANILIAYPKVKLKVGGYTDDTGDPASNLKLSSDRAKAAMDALIKKGIPKNRLSSEGYGDKFPVAGNDTEEGRAKNRRVAIRVKEK